MVTRIIDGVRGIIALPRLDENAKSANRNRLALDVVIVFDAEKSRASA